MTAKQQYKVKCGQLRQIIKTPAMQLSGPFVKVERRSMTYIYNTISQNVIYKFHTNMEKGVTGVQYRPTSHYWPVMARVAPVAGLKTRTRYAPSRTLHRYRTAIQTAANAVRP